MNFPIQVSFLRSIVICLSALLLGFSSTVSAQDLAPASLPVGTRLWTNGIVYDSTFGAISNNVMLIITAENGITDGETITGTYTYSKLSPTTAKLTFDYIDEEPGFYFHEQGTIHLTFTAGGTGSYTSAGIYDAVIDGAPLGGYYSGNGSYIMRVPPTLTDIPDQSTAEAVPITIPFTVKDGYLNASALEVTVKSSNLALLPLNKISVTGTGAERSLTLSPVTNDFGTTTITVTVSSGINSSSDTFILTVIPDNRAPIVSNFPSINGESGIAVSIPFTIDDVNSPPDSLTISLSSSNSEIFPTGSITATGSGTNRTLNLTPVAGPLGFVVITITVSDGVLSTSRLFLFNAIGPTLASWRNHHFSSSENSGDGADLNDFDGDGVVNLMEYALGTLPRDPSSKIHPTVSTEIYGGRSYLTLQVSKPPGVTGITYKAEISDDLIQWRSSSWDVNVLENSSAKLRVTDLPLNTTRKRFIRLVVTAQWPCC